jgi:ABC-type lipoprotein export system ATPase subunit
MIEVRDLKKTYHVGEVDVHALRGVNLSVERGEFVAVIGPSGSGKSTLFHILGGLTPPTSGTVHIDGQDLLGMTDAQRTELRKKHVGFVFQKYNLLPTLSAADNIAIARDIAGRPQESDEAFDQILKLLGLEGRLHHKPRALSGGEQQRAAIATALANNPRVLLADEPTGELDSATAREVFGALQTANTELGVTVLVVTHDPAVSAQVRRTIAIRDGRTSTETLRHDVADEHGNATRHAVEYAVLDRAGRVQLPRDMTEALGMRDRVRLQQDPDHIGVWPDRAAGRPGAPAAGAAAADGDGAAREYGEDTA